MLFAITTSSKLLLGELPFGWVLGWFRVRSVLWFTKLQRKTDDWGRGKERDSKAENRCPEGICEQARFRVSDNMGQRHLATTTFMLRALISTFWQYFNVFQKHYCEHMNTNIFRSLPTLRYCYITQNKLNQLFQPGTVWECSLFVGLYSEVLIHLFCQSSFSCEVLHRSG